MKARRTRFFSILGKWLLMEVGRLTEVFHKFKNSLIIHLKKTKRNWRLNCVFISDKDTAKLYVQFFTPNQPQI